MQSSDACFVSLDGKGPNAAISVKAKRSFSLFFPLLDCYEKERIWRVLSGYGVIHFHLKRLEKEDHSIITCFDDVWL